jgi:YesN/AraC family two-component response regulator
VAANAADALAIIDTGTPVDLLFTDIIMPGEMNGYQLAQAVLARRPQIKVLYTSGYTENVLMQDGHLTDGVRLLSKPYRKMDLARLVREVLDAELQPASAEPEQAVA